MAEQSVADAVTNSTAKQAPPKPPLPKALYRIVNPVLALLLRSPVHRVVSNSLMLLSFRGRKTGKRYVIPVGYLEQGSQLFLFSHAGWAKNFRGGAPVRVRRRGERCAGTATVIEDVETITRVIRLMAERHGENMVRQMGLVRDDGALPTGTTFMEITLQPRQ